SGIRVAAFSLATSDSWKDGRGERQEKTQWHRCTVWNRNQDTGLVDVVEKYVKKGDKLYVEGRVEYRQYQDKDNNTKYATDVVVQSLLMLGGGKTDASGDKNEARQRSHRNEPTPGEFDDFPGAL